MGKRILFAMAILLLIAVFLLPPFVANLEQFLLTKQLPGSSLGGDVITSLEASWDLILSGGNAAKIYFFITAITGLILLLLLAKGTGIESETKLQRITPDIITPRAAGQGQYGTAKWTQIREYKRIFSIWVVPKRSPELKQLLKAGQADRKEIRNANIQLN